MKEIINTVIRVAVLGVIVMGCFYFFKHRTRASIDQNDKSMDSTTFPEGGYGVDTSMTSLSGIKNGDFVAYRNPKDPAMVRIARVIGVEGTRVEVTAKEVIVNGKGLPLKIEVGNWTLPEFKVPRGCVYVLADTPMNGIDSKQVGPVPFANVLGTVKGVK